MFLFLSFSVCFSPETDDLFRGQHVVPDLLDDRGTLRPIRVSVVAELRGLDGLDRLRDLAARVVDSSARLPFFQTSQSSNNRPCRLDKQGGAHGADEYNHVEQYRVKNGAKRLQRLATSACVAVTYGVDAGVSQRKGENSFPFGPDSSPEHFKCLESSNLLLDLRDAAQQH